MNIQAGRTTGPQASREEEYVISIRELIQILVRRWWVVLMMAVLFVGAAVGYSLIQTPMYQASIKVLVGQEQRGDVPSQLGSDVMGLQQLTLTMSQAVTTRPVVEAVNERLNLQGSSQVLLGNLSAEQIETTQFILVSYLDSDPERAQRVANTVGEVFSDQVSEVSPSANSITATVWEEAALPGAPVSPQPVRNGLLGLVLGLMVGVGLAFLLEYLDDSWRSAEEVEQISGVPTFGVIPEFTIATGKKGGS